MALIIKFSTLIGLLWFSAFNINNSALWFDASLIRQGELWRLLSCHLIHSSDLHLALNFLAAGILAAFFDLKRDGAFFILSFSVIGLGLFLTLDPLYSYGGLSGVLYAIAVRVMWFERKKLGIGSWFFMFAIALKIVWDLSQFPAPTFSDASATLIPHAHVFGFLMAWLAIGFSAAQAVWRPRREVSVTTFSALLILLGALVMAPRAEAADGGHKVMHAASSSEIPWLDHRRLSLYIGLGYVRGSATQSEVESSVNAAGITMDSFSLNVNRLGYHFGAAYEINENFHVEGMYFNFGEVKVEASSSTVTEQQLADAFQDRLPGTGAGPLIGLKYNQWFINPYHRWFVRAGAFFTTSGYDLTGNVGIDREEQSIVFGAGYEYFYRKGLSVRAEFDTTRLNSENLFYVGPTLVIYFDEVPREAMPEPQKERDEPFQVAAEADAFDTVIYFDFDEHVIPAREQHKIGEIKRYLESHPGTVAVLKGHTDSYGTKSYNVALSNRRVKTVEQELIQVEKVQAQRLKSKYFGEDVAADGNWTPEGRQLNRRVNVCIIPEGGDSEKLCKDKADAHQVPFGNLKYHCQLNKYQAWLEARHAETEYGGCEVFHKMPGRDWLQVGRASNRLHVCTEIVEKMRVKLEKSGFKCADKSDQNKEGQ